MCGAAKMVWADAEYRDGLSPRVRGSPSLTANQGTVDRSIPTCAGQPLTRSLILWINPVYPHVCGAASAYSEDERPSDDEGLSPRVRGSRYEVRPPVVAQRSIPTCAGQPVYSFGMDGLTQVYPHVCGAALRVGGQRRYGNGLSPRVRGSHDEISGTSTTVYPHVCGAASSLQPTRRRSIPTCAGQPIFHRHLMSLLSVYPHVCGAAKYALGFSSSTNGLSPRVRGSPIQHMGEMGLSPRVRGSPSVQTHPQSSGVYPHVCGAAGFYLLEAIPWVGLSPRVRGSPTDFVKGCACLSPRVRGSRETQSSLSPRVRGSPHQHPQLPFADPRVYPHVCGAAIKAWAAMAGHGLSIPIPTCAGQPLDELMLGTPTYPSGEYSNCISPDARRPRQRCSSALHPAS